MFCLPIKLNNLKAFEKCLFKFLRKNQEKIDLVKYRGIHIKTYSNEIFIYI